MEATEHRLVTATQEAEDLEAAFGLTSALCLALVPSRPTEAEEGPVHAPIARVVAVAVAALRCMPVLLPLSLIHI